VSGLANGNLVSRHRDPGDLHRGLPDRAPDPAPAVVRRRLTVPQEGSRDPNLDHPQAWRGAPPVVAHAAPAGHHRLRARLKRCAAAGLIDPRDGAGHHRPCLSAVLSAAGAESRWRRWSRRWARPSSGAPVRGPPRSRQGLRARGFTFCSAAARGALAVARGCRGLDTALVGTLLAQAADVPLCRAARRAARGRSAPYDRPRHDPPAGGARRPQAERLAPKAGFTALKNQDRLGRRLRRGPSRRWRAFPARALPDDLRADGRLQPEPHGRRGPAARPRRARRRGPRLGSRSRCAATTSPAGARVAAAVATPIQIGENFMSVHEMETGARRRPALAIMLMAGHAADRAASAARNEAARRRWGARARGARMLEPPVHRGQGAHLLAGGADLPLISSISTSLRAVLCRPAAPRRRARLCAGGSRGAVAFAWDEAAVKALRPGRERPPGRAAPPPLNAHPDADLM